MYVYIYIYDSYIYIYIHMLKMDAHWPTATKLPPTPCTVHRWLPIASLPGESVGFAER